MNSVGPLKTSFVLAVALLASPALSSCGRQEFTKAILVADQKAPGNYMVPAKVDILLAEDNTGSVSEVYTTVSQQMPGFLLQLDAKGWDYHFATIPLVTDRPIDQVAASHYDANWGPDWKPPYPGARPDITASVSPLVFRGLFDYSAFITPADVTNEYDGLEFGFENIRTALYTRAPGIGFLRPDALLVMVVVSNGNDTSGVMFCTRNDGITLPCEQAGPDQVQYGTQKTSFDYYKAQFRALKTDGSQARMYSLVAASQTNNCLGGRSLIGTRYQSMAASLGGRSYDLCSQPLSDILSSLADNLQSAHTAFRTRYLFIDRAPDVSTISVTRFAGGDPAKAASVAQDPGNGWTYAGKVENVYAIDFPAPMDLASGYAIELHGSAKLIGDDTASVSFQASGN
jgi:hypothetical protein